MHLHEGDRLLHGLHGEGVDLDPIQDAALAAAGTAPGLDPGIGIMPRVVVAEEDHAAHGRHRLPLVVAHAPQGLQIAAAECAERCERLGSRSDVDDFRAAPSKGCSSTPSPKEYRRSSSISSASARRLVEPTRLQHLTTS